jgi:hypothetical protein
MAPDIYTALRFSSHAPLSSPPSLSHGPAACLPLSLPPPRLITSRLRPLTPPHLRPRHQPRPLPPRRPYFGSGRVDPAAPGSIRGAGGGSGGAGSRSGSTRGASGDGAAAATSLPVAPSRTFPAAPSLSPSLPPARGGGGTAEGVGVVARRWRGRGRAAVSRRQALRVHIPI